MRGYHKTTICRLVKRGFFQGAIVPRPGKKRVLLDSDKADELLKKNQDPNFTKNGVNTKTLAASPAGKTFYKFRAESEWYRAKLLEQKFEAMRNQYILRDQVRREARKAGDMAKKIFLDAAQRITKKVSAEPDEFECFRIIREELKTALREYVRKIKET